MTIIGRLTKDAVVNQLKDDRQVVNFSVAVNDYYKAKGQEKGTTVTNYFTCSYWLTPKVAERLKKGALVELDGRIGMNVYTDMQGNAKGSLTFHVNNVTVHTSAKSKQGVAIQAEAQHSDDLPF